MEPPGAREAWEILMRADVGDGSWGMGRVERERTDAGAPGREKVQVRMVCGSEAGIVVGGEVAEAIVRWICKTGLETL